MRDLMGAYLRKGEQYDKFRPEVPSVLIDSLARLCRVQCPDVVDLGCGTGLSTFPWTRVGKSVVGIEPLQDMICIARRKANLYKKYDMRFIERGSDDTGLVDGCADIVTASSCLHWLPLKSTKTEIVRILRPNGIFAYFGPYKIPLTPYLTVDEAFGRIDQEIMRWAEDENRIPAKLSYEVIRQEYLSGLDFDIQRVFYLHQEVLWSSDDYLGYVLSRGRLVEWVGEHGFPMRKGWADFCELVHSNFREDGRIPCVFTYKVHVLRKKA